MNFQFNFPIPESEHKINFGVPIIFMGSCFSDEIGNEASFSGLQSLSNPFGTLFHPFAIGQTIIDCLNETQTCELVQQDDVFFHWGSAGKVHGYSENELKNVVNEIRNQLKTQLQQASHLFITFGTAKGYQLKSSQKIVANCHKQAPSNFEVIHSKSDEIVEFWKPILVQLFEFNPKLQVVFTVSPVRHLKDGIVENNRSKSNLLLAVERLSEIQNCSYFPSYEIVMDELRDYRFFKNDFAHPNELAIQYVWERFSHTFFTEETSKQMQQVRAIKTSLNHKGMYLKSMKLAEHHGNTLNRKAKLDSEIEGIWW
jgi:hypothetical protein